MAMDLEPGLPDPLIINSRAGPAPQAEHQVLSIDGPSTNLEWVHALRVCKFTKFKCGEILLVLLTQKFEGGHVPSLSLL